MYNEDETGYDYCQQDNPNDNLDIAVRKITPNIEHSTFEAKINFEFDEDYSTSKSIWEEMRTLVQKPWFREAVIISAILVLKASLMIALRKAQEEGIEIENL